MTMSNKFVLSDFHMEEKLERYLTAHSPIVSMLKISFFLLKRKLLSIRKQSSFKDNIQHIAFELAGGLGDICIHAKYLHYFYKAFGPDLNITVVAEEKHHELLKLIFSECSFIQTITADKRAVTYDLYVRLVRFPEIKYYDQSRLSENLSSWANSTLDFFKQNRMLLVNDFIGRCYSEIRGKTRETQADINDYIGLVRNDDFRINFPDKSVNILDKSGLKNDEYILVQTGPGIAFKEFKNDVRQWPVEHYQKLISIIKAKRPDLKIVQIGFDYQAAIKGTDINLQGKTTVEELLFLLKHAKLLVAQEGGCAIARHFISGKISCILFGPTNKSFLGFSENLNISANVCPGCEWVVRDWVHKCIRGKAEPECMCSITPEYVFAQIQNRGIL